MEANIVEFYSRPQYGEGGFFVGQRTPQIGGSFIGGVGRFLIPILKTVGKNLLGIGAKTADDVLSRNVPLKKALLKNTTDQLDSFINNNNKRPPTKRRRKA